jgi:hypothetical protein
MASAAKEIEDSFVPAPSRLTTARPIPPGKLAADITQVDVKGFCSIVSAIYGAAVVDPCTLWFSISCVRGAKRGETDSWKVGYYTVTRPLLGRSGWARGVMLGSQ